MRKILILKLTLQSWCKPSENWDMGQGQGQGWELVAEKLSGCSEAEGFVTHLETHSALAWVAAPPTPPPPPAHHLCPLRLSTEPSPHLLHTSLFFSSLTRTKARSRQGGVWSKERCHRTRDGREPEAPGREVWCSLQHSREV